ncbi:MAG: hypothetical protein AAF674_08330 [Pseudomonadota bacterium]
MAKRSLTRFLPLLLYAIPAVFLYFGINSALYRIDVRADAVPAEATVEAVYIDTYTCKDSDGNRRTCTRVAYDLILEMDGLVMQRPLLEGNFEPDEIWHSDDMIPPTDYPEGATMAVLVRPDLDYRVAIDSFWSAYVLPIVLCTFGGFWLFASIFIVPQLMRDTK